MKNNKEVLKMEANDFMNTEKNDFFKRLTNEDLNRQEIANHSLQYDDNNDRIANMSIKQLLSAR